MAVPGPSDPLRTVGAESMLPLTRRAAAACGVTQAGRADPARPDRSAGLACGAADEPGAERPSGQGCERCRRAGRRPARGGRKPSCRECPARWTDLLLRGPPTRGTRARIGRFRAGPRLNRRRPTPQYEWLEALDLVSGGPIYLPFDLVSLDFTRNVPSPFDRASDGVAAGASREEAIAVALHEIIERDAVVEWKSRGLLACTADALQVEIRTLRLASRLDRTDRSGRCGPRFLSCPLDHRHAGLRLRAQRLRQGRRSLSRDPWQRLPSPSRAGLVQGAGRGGPVAGHVHLRRARRPAARTIGTWQTAPSSLSGCRSRRR